MFWRTNDWVYAPVFREGIGDLPGEKVIATLMICYRGPLPETQPRTDIRKLVTVINK